LLGAQRVARLKRASVELLTIDAIVVDRTLTRVEANVVLAATVVLAWPALAVFDQDIANRSSVTFFLYLFVNF
jgi:hypothetical protein